ncbi:MAG TPA: GntP family permease [Deltaproteobacteria bacterium]|nr:GntP family permease [Deltaproteobacteria bacterium]
MVSGGIALLYLVLAIALIIYLTARYHMNAFVVLLLVAFLYGLFSGMPLPDIVKNIRTGFGNTLAYIGIVIVAGTIIGTILEKTGGALAMTNTILRVVGKDRSPLAMSIAGYVVSIPVFCDSGFVILTPLNKALAEETGKSMAVMAVALATGLYATHCLVPPTPGPIAAAGILNADLGMLIGVGLIASIPPMIAGYLWATLFAKRYEIKAQLAESYDSLLQKYGKLPSTTLSFAPIVVPIVLILFKSVSDFPTKPFGEGLNARILSFIGDPVTALLIGVFLALLLVKSEAKKEAISSWMDLGVKNAALILAITGAGGSFGAILKASPMGDFLGNTLSTYNLGILLPFIIAAALKTAQGSSTVAIITTASIMAPLIESLGLHPVLTVLAIGAGSMTVSHANDSYFWVVSQFSDMEVPVAYRAYTTATLVEGVVAIIGIMILSFFITV